MRVLLVAERGRGRLRGAGGECANTHPRGLRIGSGVDIKQLFVITGMVSKKYGGVEEFFLAVANKCRLRGIPCTLIYKGPLGSESYCDDLKYAGARVEIVSEGFIPALITYVRLFYRHRDAVIFTHFLPEAGTGLLAGFLCRVRKRVHMIHGTLLQGSDQFRGSSRRRGFIKIWLRTVWATDFLAVSTESARQFKCLLNIPDRKVAIHHIGISEYRERFISKSQRGVIGDLDDAFVLGNVCFHAHVKGVDNAIQVLAEIRKRHKHVRLLQVGGNDMSHPYTARLHRLAADLGVAESITWVGKVDNVRDLLGEYVDVYCHFSRREGLGLVNAEAMQMGLPVVAYDVGGVSDVVKHEETGFLVRYGNSADAAAAIEKLLRDPALRRMMGERGRRFVETNFSLEHQVDRLFEEHLFRCNVK